MVLSLKPTLGAVSLLLAVGIVPAASQDAQTVSVTQEEQRVYEAVLDSWLGSEAAGQLINEHLSPPPSATDPDNAECVAGQKFQDLSGTVHPNKSLSGVNFRLPGLQLVDGDSWHPSDPEDHMANGNVEGAVKQAFAHSLLTLSEVAFSENGHDALVEMRMVCGRLCGTGFTLRMHEANGKWKVARRCGGYVS